ncbi:MAG: TetR family transcriptional regulator [Kiritimatiellales bacterium]
MKRTKAEAMATKESVLKSALVLFSERGYTRTTFTDIARRIGMTRGAVYWHFENKQTLLAELIDHMHAQKQERVGLNAADIRSISDFRAAFVAYAKLLTDPVIRKFEFFLNYQMEWSEELLTQTHEMMAKLRNDPLDELKKSLSAPAIKAQLRPDVNLDHLVITLASFWVGLSNIYLGHSGEVNSNGTKRNGTALLDQMDIEKAAADGFDLIIGSVLKKESEHE